MRKLTDTILYGSSEEVLAGFPDNYFDSVVTDPPYGLGFMGKKWDKDVPALPIWESVYRVLKPGGYMLVCCGTRTQHIMISNVAAAGFKIRDIIMWIYGSGFPKSRDVSKDIDRIQGAKRSQVIVPASKIRNPKSIRGGHGVKGGDRPWMQKAEEVGYHEMDSQIPATDVAEQWHGWGTNLKPSVELWTVCRKPLSEKTIARNILKHGTGAINIEGTRIGTETRTYGGAGYSQVMSEGKPKGGIYDGHSNAATYTVTGRWPANVILEHHHDCRLMGTKKVKAVEGIWNLEKVAVDEHGDETIDDWECHPECPVWIMDEQTKKLAKAPSRFFYQAKPDNDQRFFYCKKCVEISKDRLSHEDHKDKLEGHPTQKPEDLMRYLVRLITPPGGVVLDPFVGSGSTCVGAKLEGIDSVGIERDVTYHALARVRYRYAGQGVLQNRPFSGLET